MQTLYPDPKKQVIFRHRVKVEFEHKYFGIIGLTNSQSEDVNAERVNSWVNHILFSSYV